MEKIESKKEQSDTGLEERKSKIETCKKRNIEWIEDMLKKVRARKELGDRPDIDWADAEQQWLREKELVEEILDLGKEAGILIDPQYYMIPMGLARKIGIQRLGVIKDLLNKFVPFKKIQGCLKEINFQAEESYFSLGCGGFFHDGISEIPKYKTFDTENIDDFFATFIHEAVGHPVEILIQKLDSAERMILEQSYETIKSNDSFFSGTVGRIYPLEEMRGSFSQFVAEFAKQFCLEGEALKGHIQNLSNESRVAYETFYNFFRTKIFDGHEFGEQDLESFVETRNNLKSAEKK